MAYFRRAKVSYSHLEKALILKYPDQAREK